MLEAKLVKLRKQFSLSRPFSEDENQIVLDIEELKKHSELLLTESDLIKFYVDLDSSCFVENFDSKNFKQQLTDYFQDLYLLSIHLLKENQRNDSQIVKFAYYQFVSMIKAIKALEHTKDINSYIQSLIEHRLYDNFSYSQSFRLGDGLATIKSPKSTIYDLKHLINN